MEWSQWFVLSWIQFAVSSLLILVMIAIILRWISQTVQKARLIHASFLLLTALPFLSFITIVPTWRIDINAWLVSSYSDNLAHVSPVPTVGQVNASRESLHASILDRETTTVRSAGPQSVSTSPSVVMSDLCAMTEKSDVPRSLVTDREQTPTLARGYPWAVAFALILSLQLVGCGWYMVVGLLGRIQLRRILRNSSIVSANVLERWSHVSHGHGSTVKILESESITTPMTFGCWAPIIVIPSNIGRQEGDDLDACLAHEWAHIQHKDAWIFTWANLLRIVYWYQPSVHMLCRELRVCQELIADRTAVRTVAEPIQYSELLMRLSAARPRPIPSGALTMVRPTSQLSRRIRALLEPDSITSTRCGFRFNVCIGLVLLAMLLSVSVIRINQVEANEPTVEQAEAVPKELRAMTFVRKVVPRDNTKSPRNYRDTVVQDGRYRSEALMADQSNDVISISDGSDCITIYRSSERYAQGIEYGASIITLQHLESIKNARTEATELLGGKVINGRSSIGFSIQQFQRKYAVWSDATTGELVQIEFDDFCGDHVTMNQFQLEPKVEESLFLCDIPKGFQPLRRSVFSNLVHLTMDLTSSIQPPKESFGVSKIWERSTLSEGIVNANGEWFWILGFQQIDAIDGNNVRLFSFPVDADSLSCIDIDKDGTDEIVVIKSVFESGRARKLASRKISLFSSRGDLMWTYDKPVKSIYESISTAFGADVHGDAKNEVILAKRGNGASRLPFDSIALDSNGRPVDFRLLGQGIADISPLQGEVNSEMEYAAITSDRKLQIMDRFGQQLREIASGLRVFSIRVHESSSDKKEQILAVGFHEGSKVNREIAFSAIELGRRGALTLSSYDRGGEMDWEVKLRGEPSDLSFCPNKPLVAVVQQDVVQVIDLSTGKEVASVPGRRFRASDAAWVKGANGVPLLVLRESLTDEWKLAAYRIDE